METVLGGTPEALLQGQADLAISPEIPAGFLGDPLTRLRFIAVAHPNHPLHKLGRMLTTRDLRGQRHLVVRDSGAKRASRTTGVQADQRWTVSHMSTSIQAASMGYGFAWLPEEKIRAELAAGVLKPLPLREGQERVGDLYLIFANRDYAGPGTLRLTEIIREMVGSECTRHSAAQSGHAAAPGKKKAPRRRA